MERGKGAFKNYVIKQGGVSEVSTLHNKSQVLPASLHYLLKFMKDTYRLYSIEVQNTLVL